MADELQHYLDEATASFEARGLSGEDARRAALREMGSLTARGEEVRSAGWEHAIETLIADLRYASRRLRSNPGFSLVVVLTLALGIGASTSMFSAANPILFERLPYPHPDRIVMFWDFGRDGSRLEATFGTYRELVERSHSFEALAVMRAWQPTLTGAAQPERLDGQRVSAGYFKVLGIAPILGRGFSENDDRINAPRTLILSDRLWRRRFNADPAIVGTQVLLDDDPYIVIGVMPHDFENVLASSAELWRPLQYDASFPSPEGREWGHHLRMTGRLRAGVSADQARRDVDAIAHNPVAAFARPRWAALKQSLVINALQDDVTRAVRPALLAVLAAVALLLVIACVNVTNLLLGRGAQRRGEFAMRAALGASRARLVRQLLTESVLLALFGGALGVGIAAAGVRTLVAFGPAELPRVNAIGVDATALVFALGVTMAVGLSVGLIPALYAWRGNLQLSVQQSSRQVVGHQWTRRALVVVEVALALLLLVGAGLLLRSLQHLFAVPAGFTATGLLTMQVQTSGRRFDDADTTHRFFAGTLEAVRRVPGVEAAALTSQLPLSGDYDLYGVHFEANRTQKFGEDRGAFRYAVTPGYFAAMDIPLLRGRVLDERDGAGKPLAAVLGESFAKRKFPGQDPIGRRLHVGPDTGPWFTVVGVVGDVKQMSLAVTQEDAIYIPTTQWLFPDQALWLVVRTRGDAAALTAAVRNAVWSVDKDQPIVRVAEMEDLVAASAAERRFALILFEAFSVFALVLAATGIYGVLASGVTERLRELGVRAALGASRSSILALVVRQGLLLTGVGIAIGLVGAVATSRGLATLLFSVSPLDAITYGGVTTLLLVVSAVACVIPACRPARVDPSITLRAE